MKTGSGLAVGASIIASAWMQASHDGEAALLFLIVAVILAFALT